jgi:hypothetical protein
MVRGVLVVMLTATTAASAQTATRPTLWSKSPTTRPVATAPTVAATQPGPVTFAPPPTNRPPPQPTELIGADPNRVDERLVRAVALMRERKLSEAGKVLEEICNDTPPEQRTRPLVLNRAIVDIQQRRLLMRGIKELGEYLTRNRAEDEPATNVLGNALAIAIEDEKVKENAVMQMARTEFDRRHYVLDHSRKGYRRWGPQWIPEAEFDALEKEKKAHDAGMEAQRAVVDRLYWSVSSLMEERKNVVKTIATSPTIQFDNPLYLQREEALKDVQRIDREVAVVNKDYEKERRKLQLMQKQSHAPVWPKALEPVEANELSPPAAPIVITVKEAKPPDPANPFAPAK